MIDLDTLQKEEQYKVPEGFFDQFPQQVMNQIRKEKAKRRNIWLSAVAAVMALVICSVTVIRYMQQDDVRQQNIVQTQSQDSQLEEQMVDYYSNELAQMDYLNF
jgi:Tfp pilus assembly protein PilN